MKTSLFSVKWGANEPFLELFSSDIFKNMIPESDFWFLLWSLTARPDRKSGRVRVFGPRFVGLVRGPGFGPEFELNSAPVHGADFGPFFRRKLWFVNIKYFVILNNNKETSNYGPATGFGKF